MSIPSAFATALAVALLLGGCAPSSTPTTHPGTPRPTVSHPAFMAIVQSDIDRLPNGVADAIQIAPDSTRFQGTWDARQVFLAVKGADSVCLVTGLTGDDSSWKAGCGDGNGVVTDELPDGATVKYLPIVTSAAPEGWTRLS
ncbi:MAG: hypothetical protein ABJA11_05880, partial [Pseudolysinimonas sp.]